MDMVDIILDLAIIMGMVVIILAMGTITGMADTIQVMDTTMDIADFILDMAFITDIVVFITIEKLFKCYKLTSKKVEDTTAVSGSFFFTQREELCTIIRQGCYMNKLISK